MMLIEDVKEYFSGDIVNKLPNKFTPKTIKNIKQLVFKNRQTLFKIYSYFLQ